MGADVNFPSTGTDSGLGGIFALTSNSYQLNAIGKYDVSFWVSVAEAGQLELTLNTVPLANTVTGRATGTNYIMARVFITTTVINSVITVRNPSGNAAALTITPISGGTHAVTAHLSILRLT